MIIVGTYGFTKQKDYKSGYTYFLFEPADKNFPRVYGKYIGVKGVIQDCPSGTPMEIECELKQEPDKKPQYILKDYKFPTENTEIITDLLETLCMRNFADEKKAKIQKSNLDLFSYDKKTETAENLRKLGFSADDIEQILTQTLALSGVKKTADVLTRFGADYAAVKAVYRAFGANNELDSLLLHPYRMLKYGIPFRICENIAYQNGVSQYNRERLLALLENACQLCMQEGHTRFSFPMLLKKIKSLEKSGNCGWITDPLYFAALMTHGEFVLTKDNDEWYVTTSRLWKIESSIASNILRLRLSQENDISMDEIIHKTEEALGIQYAPQQKEAFRLLKSSGVKILTGGPGTGKTTTVAGLIYAEKLIHPKAEILLCAPTATAARRASEAAGIRASTIHKMLDIRPIGDRLIQFRDENNRLTADMIIVDEMSMVDTEVFYMLLRAIKNTAVVLLVGDENQLQSVGAGNVLHDILESGIIDSCRLTKVYRQLVDSLIVANSIKICAGDVSLKSGNDYELIACHNESEMYNALMAKVDMYYNPEQPLSTKIFSPIRKYTYTFSTWKINKELHKKYHNSEEEEFRYNAQLFSVGDPVIFNRNNYETGYCNGDMGIITGIISEENGSKTLLINSESGDFALTGADFADLELSYAITAHKSQGGECDTAIIVLPEEPKSMLTRSLIYVAATRAKKKCIIIYQEGALQYGIKNDFQCKRLTGLNYQLIQKTQK